jgi:gamma-glutamyl-gamma-aminobutyrate hydrolase PuuD
VTEAVEMPGKSFVVAVQWHPEDLVQTWPEQLRLFERLAVSVGAAAILAV